VAAVCGASFLSTIDLDMIYIKEHEKVLVKLACLEYLQRVTYWGFCHDRKGTHSAAMPYALPFVKAKVEIKC